MSMKKVIEVARGELGTCEEPSGSNIQKYGAAFGLNAAPWCVIFLWWVFQQAGERMAFFGGGKTASCSTLLRWYREQGLTVPVDEVQVGDIVILNFHWTKDTEHCGLVTEVNRWAVTRELMQIQTIEGNTSVNGSQDNGGMVAEKTRYPYQIVAVCRPQYKEEEPVLTDTKPDYADHWAYKDIVWVKDKGFMQGYPDGSFRPDQPVTRAELAAVLRRLAEMEGKK